MTTPDPDAFSEPVEPGSFNPSKWTFNQDDASLVIHALPLSDVDAQVMSRAIQQGDLDGMSFDFRYGPPLPPRASWWRRIRARWRLRKFRPS